MHFKKKMAFLMGMFVVFGMGVPFINASVIEQKTECGFFECETILRTDFNVPTAKKDIYIGDVLREKQVKDFVNTKLQIHEGNVKDVNIHVKDKNTIIITGKIEGATQNKWGMELMGDKSFLGSTWWNSTFGTRNSILNATTKGKVLWLNTGNQYGTANGVNNETTYLYNNSGTYAVANETDEYCFFDPNGSTKSCPNPPDGLLSYWTFDESSGDALDLIGDNNGTLDGDVTQGATGKVNKAYDFDGTGDAVSLPTGIFDTGDKTITAWVNPGTGYSGGKIYSFQKDISLNCRCYDGDSGQPNNCEHWIDGTSHYSKAFYSTGTWYHYAVTYDSSDGGWVVYINGSEVDSFTDALSFGSGSGNRIGADDGDQQYWDGKIDDFRVYDRPLSSTEIQNLYDSSPYAYLNGTTEAYPNATTTTTTTTITTDEVHVVKLPENIMNDLNVYFGTAFVLFGGLLLMFIPGIVILYILKRG